MPQDGKIDLSELRYFFRTCGQTDVVAELWLHKSSKSSHDGIGDCFRDLAGKKGKKHKENS
jgi:hypothetical protein